MPNSAPSVSFETSASGFASGLVGTIGVRVMDGTGGTTITRRTTNVVESPANSGIYTAVLTAPALEGQYLIVWDTGGATPEFASEELLVTYSVPDPAPSFLECPVEDVASLLRARTKDDSGNEVGDFNANTRPTSDEVEDLIAQSAAMVAAVANGDVPSRLVPFAQHVVALRTAMMVELTYWPEQVQRENSPYGHIREMFTDALEAFKVALGDSGGVRGYGPVSVKIKSTIEEVAE